MCLIQIMISNMLSRITNTYIEFAKMAIDSITDLKPVTPIPNILTSREKEIQNQLERLCQGIGSSQINKLKIIELQKELLKIRNSK